MFSETVHYPSGRDMLDQHQSKELGRYITASRKKNLVLHSLLHNRCKFCINSFSSTGCRNCCLPICQDFKKVNTKKLLQNTVHNRNLNTRAYPNIKKAIRSVGHLGVNPCEPAFLEAPAGSSTARLSPSLSVRNLVTSQPTNGSTKSSSPVPSEVNLACELPIDKMSLNELSAPIDLQLQGSRLDLPSAPSPGLVLFNNEEQSDLIFLVGKDENKLWRFPAHSFILEDASSFFKAIASANEKSPSKETKEIRINWCEPDTFHAILKYTYTNEVVIKSISVAMVLFNAANSFCLFRLSKLCLTFLCNHCSDENVLEMMAFFHGYLKHVCDLSAENKPDKVCSEPAENDDLLEILNRIIIRCYAIIDFYAPKIISSEEFANLSYDLVGNILWRDTLNVTTELEVFSAINQWACQQCKKTCKELTDKNKRDILGELVFYPRYLTMSMDDFLKGPYNSEILSNEEKQLLLDKLKSPEQVQLPKQMEIFKMDVERRYEEMFEDDDDDDASSVTDSACDDKVDSIQKQMGDQKNGLSGKKKKKSKSKKILNGLGEVVLCVIKLLD